MAGHTHLFLAPASGATGEVAQGLRLAWQLHAHGDRVLFLAPAIHGTLLRATPFPHGRLDGRIGDLATILPAVVAEKRADDVVLIDLTSTLVALSHHRCDPAFLGRMRVPVLALDLWSVGDLSTGYDVGGESAGRPAPARDLVPRRIVPVPFARPESKGACGFWPEGPPVDRAAARAALGSGDERLLVLATSVWQSALRASPAMANVPRRLVAELARLGEALRVVHVGPAPLPGAEELGGRYRHLPPVPPDGFRRLVGAADVYVTLNQVACSTAVALDLGVPAVAIIGRDPPFRAWPGGFDRFFGEVLAGNPYAELVRAVALEDRDALADALLRPRADRAALAAYRAQVAALPRAAALIDGWLT